MEVVLDNDQRASGDSMTGDQRSIYADLPIDDLWAIMRAHASKLQYSRSLFEAAVLAEKIAAIGSIFAEQDKAWKLAEKEMRDEQRKIEEEIHREIEELAKNG